MGLGSVDLSILPDTMSVSVTLEVLTVRSSSSMLLSACAEKFTWTLKLYTYRGVSKIEEGEGHQCRSVAEVGMEVVCHTHFCCGNHTNNGDGGVCMQ